MYQIIPKGNKLLLEHVALCPETAWLDLAFIKMTIKLLNETEPKKW